MLFLMFSHDRKHQRRSQRKLPTKNQRLVVGERSSFGCQVNALIETNRANPIQVWLGCFMTWFYFHSSSQFYIILYIQSFPFMQVSYFRHSQHVLDHHSFINLQWKDIHLASYLKYYETGLCAISIRVRVFLVMPTRQVTVMVSMSHSYIKFHIITTTRITTWY